MVQDVHYRSLPKGKNAKVNQKYLGVYFPPGFSLEDCLLLSRDSHEQESPCKHLKSICEISFRCNTFHRLPPFDNGYAKNAKMITMRHSFKQGYASEHLCFGRYSLQANINEYITFLFLEY